MNPALIPVTIIAPELGTTADELATRLADAVELDTIGVRCLPADTAIDLITNHRQALQAEQDRKAAQRETARRQPNPTRQRVKALRAAQEGWQGDPEAPALARALAADPDNRLNKSDAALQEMMSGELVQHRYRQETDR